MSGLHGGAPWRARCLLAAAIVAAGVLAGVQPAAADSLRYLRPSGWAYTDSRTPHTPYLDKTVDAPVGAWRDARGKVHRSRAYFAYDISSYRGHRIVGAHLVLGEVRVNNCDAARDLEIWATDPIRPRSTWAHPPRERALLGRIGPIDNTVCPLGYIEFDVSAAVIAAALAAGESTLYLGIRVPHAREADPAYGRHLKRDPGISLHSNAVPKTPDNVRLGIKSCAGTELAIGTARPEVRAFLSDPEPNPYDSTWLRPTVAIWPLDHPDQRREWELSQSPPELDMQWTVPEGVLVHGGRYALAVRSRDAHDVSPWSAECRFSVDTVRPAAPSVSSPDYPNENWPGWGGPGLAGAFTFDPNGVADVVGYGYEFPGGPYREFVAAPAPGAPLTVHEAPRAAGPTWIYAWSIDAAGNRSDRVQHSFWVRDSAPRITDTEPDGWVARARDVVFRPGELPLANYTYRLGDGPEQTVAAAADGTARVSVTPPLDGVTLSVYGTSADGTRSGTASLLLKVSTRPVVTSPQLPHPQWDQLPPGVTANVTFAPHMPGVVGYVYEVNRGMNDALPARTVAAGADGTATVDVAPLRSGQHTLHVHSVTADGTASETTVFEFSADYAFPEVSSQEYPEWGPPSGGVGVPGTFTFRSSAVDVVGYTYSFNDGPEQTVNAAEDGSAALVWTPTEYPPGGWINLRVRSRSANGYVSDPWVYSFVINPPASTG
ncbi:hypothetical protein Val02_64890 [Virgisporangium aliadipatigenens]|uniref:Uncharacterized protein n=1 Tax=Virgisporangium aliadipatigenens TaxID=741659 RepID=A0A8J4DU17_9ACTN|nr:hypothetical protein [Virgisporangium aliadipatigenens]GIJ49603.1 hypothetical protein Val02_64890 [Virgisporangium aliadipatigenens]